MARTRKQPDQSKSANLVQGKVVAYLRISSDTQDLAGQELQIRQYADAKGLTVAQWFKAEVSSRKDTRSRKVDALMNALEPHDTLILAELSRLGRSISEVVRLIDTLVKRKVRVVCIKESIDLPANGEKDLTATIMVTLFCLFAEVERTLISERTKAGLAAARAQGRIGGRPKGRGSSKLDQHREEIEKLLKLRVPKRFIAQQFKVSEQGFFSWLRREAEEK